MLNVMGTHLDSDLYSLIAVTDHAEDARGEGGGQINDNVRYAPRCPRNSQPERPHMSLSPRWGGVEAQLENNEGCYKNAGPYRSHNERPDCSREPHERKPDCTPSFAFRMEVLAACAEGIVLCIPIKLVFRVRHQVRCGIIVVDASEVRQTVSVDVWEVVGVLCSGIIVRFGARELRKRNLFSRCFHAGPGVRHGGGALK